MKIIKVSDPVHYAARIEAQIIMLNVHANWRTGLRAIWDIVGQFHVFVTYQVGEEAAACEDERPHEHHDA